MADVTKEIALKVVANDATGPALQSLEDKLNAAKKRMVELAAAGKQNTEEFQRLQVEAGNYKRTIEGVEQSVDSFAKGGSRALTLIVEASQAVAAGFAIAQGAAALFGDENEDLQKAMVQVQGAMALVNGVQQISILLTQKSVITTQAAAAAQKVYAIAIGTSTGAMKAFRIALLATGIGAAVAAIGLLIAKWDELTAAVRRYLNLPDPKQRAMEEGLALARQEAQLENYRDAYEKHTNDLIEKDKKRKETQKELFEIQKKYRNDLLLLNAENFRKELIAIDQKYAADLAKLKKHGKDTADLEAIIRKEKLDKEKEFAIQLRNVQQERADMKKEADDKQEQDDIARMQREGTRRTTQANNELEGQKKRLEDEKFIQEQKVKLASDGFKTIGELATAFAGSSEESQKRAFNVNKAAGIAQTIIDTFAAAQGAYKSQMTVPDPSAPIRASVAAGIAIAQGLARVAAISKTQFKSTSTGTPPPTPSGTSSSTPAPTFINPQTTNLGTGELSGGQGQGSQPMRAYVVERDIQQTTSRVRRLSEFATLG